MIILPGSRARLLSYKLRRDPRLAKSAQGWHFLKFRHLRELAAQEGLSADAWLSAIAEDPLTDEATQMQLFPNMS